MCYTWSYHPSAEDWMLSNHLPDFFETFMNTSMVTDSPWKTDRMIIRESKHLNKLLYDNTPGLRCIFENNKDEKVNLFTKKSAQNVCLSF